jgi:hypothetical protein
MDRKLKKYQKIIIAILNQYIELPSEIATEEELEEQLIIDTARNHFQILAIGWEKGKRVYYPVFHLDIKNGKIWVQEDATDFNIVSQLQRQGVPAADIVLAFHSPFKRPLTGYAVA